MYKSILIALLSVIWIATSGESSSLSAGQLYWNNVLPNTSMPKAIKDLLMHPAAGSTTKVFKTKTPNSHSIWNKGSTIKVFKTKTPNSVATWNEGSTTKVFKPKTPNSVTTWNEGSTTKVFKPKTPNSVTTWNEGSTTKVFKTKTPNSHSIWNKGSTTKVMQVVSQENQHSAENEKYIYDPTITTYFLEKDFQPGKKMTLYFPDPSSYGATFLPRTYSNSIPFTSSKLQNILTIFSIDPNSPAASEMKETLTTCEYKPMDGEIKRCATSLESMVDFVTSALGTHNLLSISTTTDKENTPKQEYQVASSAIKSSGDNTVVCHAMTYTYAVYYCHKLKGVDVYAVELVGADGSKAKAVATCHRDTTKWNPKHEALQILNVKPGTVPVCHFPPQYDVLWVTKE